MKIEEDEEPKGVGILPEPTRANWKLDLERVVENRMSIDEFLCRWSGREIVEGKEDLGISGICRASSLQDIAVKVRSIMAAPSLRGQVDDITRNEKIFSVLLEARRRMGV